MFGNLKRFRSDPTHAALCTRERERRLENGQPPARAALRAVQSALREGRRDELVEQPLPVQELKSRAIAQSLRNVLKEREREREGGFR